MRWRLDEFQLLIDLVEREGFGPSVWSQEALASELKRRGAEWTNRAYEPSFRSVASIGSQLYRLSLLARGDPRGEREAPAAMRQAWALTEAGRQERVRALVAKPSRRIDEQDAVDDAYRPDRLDLIDFLVELRTLLNELIERGELLRTGEQEEEFHQAWRHIEASRAFALARERLEDPGIGSGLATYGLVGPPRRLKVNGFRRALRRLAEGWTWVRLKPVLKWANVILGSLTNVLPLIDPIKEFKESWEAAAEDAYEGNG